ncbi:MAG: topoisomerase IV, partial [Oscillospiraceae bacterium]|nr:topoisomerase IV [Oscillospiraceae bacterium]
GNKTKSANIVGQTMKLNPHGDQVIYETMVRLARGNEALLHPYVDSKGNFGKAYSRDMAYAAPRYTEAKLDPICAELFRDIDKETVDFVPNYDNETVEPTLFPTTFPNILVNNNMGIAVSMASNVCSFNLKEVCEAAIGLIKDPDFNISSVIQGPDFPGGGYIVRDDVEMEKILRTGRGQVRVRSKYNYDRDDHCIEVTEIPPTTTIEQIKDKIVELAKGGKLSDVNYIRDESDLHGLKIAIDIKKSADPDELMRKLFRMTPLEDTFTCNFNILVAGYPKVIGVYEILTEWTAFRRSCVERRIFFELTKKKEKLHLLYGLRKILLDIDKAVRIVRETEEESEVVPNLMIGFGIDEKQAEFVAEIKLRHLNREYILKRISEVDELEKDIAQMQATLDDRNKIYDIIIEELKEVIKKYAQPRRSMFYFPTEEDEVDITVDDTPDYPVNLFFTREGYFKKITPQSLRMSGEQKLKDGDSIAVQIETTNRAELLFFTDKATVYKAKAADFPDTKASAMGDYVPAALKFDEGENVIAMIPAADYEGYLFEVFENGKAAKVPVSAYQTKLNRRKLANAYNDRSPLAAIYRIEDDVNIALASDKGRMIVFNTALILPKTTRNTQGVQAMNLKSGAKITSAVIVSDEQLPLYERYCVKNIPVMGLAVKDGDDPDQMKLI